MQERLKVMETRVIIVREKLKVHKGGSYLYVRKD